MEFHIRSSSRRAGRPDREIPLHKAVCRPHGQPAVLCRASAVKAASAAPLAIASWRVPYRRPPDISPSASCGFARRRAIRSLCAASSGLQHHSTRRQGVSGVDWIQTQGRQITKSRICGLSEGDPQAQQRRPHASSRLGPARRSSNSLASLAICRSQPSTDSRVPHPLPARCCV
jgi:hypothetical protein